MSHRRNHFPPLVHIGDILLLETAVGVDLILIAIFYKLLLLLDFDKFDTCVVVLDQDFGFRRRLGIQIIIFFVVVKLFENTARHWLRIR